MENGSEPIEGDELLYRRFPVSAGWYSPEVLPPNSQAFAPHKTLDVTGLSISRQKYKTARESARSRQGHPAYVAVLRAQPVLACGIAIVPRPQPDDPGHAEMPDLNASNRKDDLTLQRQVILANLCLRVEGPFTFDKQQETAKNTANAAIFAVCD